MAKQNPSFTRTTIVHARCSVRVQSVLEELVRAVGGYIVLQSTCSSSALIPARFPV